MTSFKQFLTEASNRKEVDIDTAVQLYLENCKQWPDIKLALFRSSDTDYESPVVGVPRVRHEESLGGSQQIQRWMRTQQEWKAFPDRRKSTFCSTAKSSAESDFGWRTYRVIPYDDTPLAVWPKDFNLSTVRIKGISITLPGIEWRVADLIDTHRMVGAFGQDFAHQIKVVNQNSDYLPKTGSDGAVVELAKNPMKYLSPEAIGAILYQNPSQYKKPSTKSEVWFSGKFLQIPEKQWQEFGQAVRKIQRDQA